MHLTAKLLSLPLLKAALCSSFVLNTGKASRLPSAHRSTPEDLFDYFDPLLSPHAYPNGIQPGEQPQEMASKSESEAFSGADEGAASTNPPPSQTNDLFFDPTISPHQYASGTPTQVLGDRRATKTGILLIDHGSRRPDANQRLDELARLYQQSLDSDNTIVAAAHMEIASPSIQDGIASLLRQGVDEIICHPYFLSPGRHVQEDIPSLVKEAREALNVAIPVVITEPLGSNTALMIDAIDGMVKRASEAMDRSR